MGLLNMSPERMAMLQAGLGMMANSSGPNAGNAIGAGALHGVNSYQNAMQQQQEQKRQQSLDQQMKQQRDQESLLRQMQIDGLTKKADRQSASDAALSQIMTSQAPTFEGGKQLVEGYQSPQDLHGMYQGMIGSGNPDLAMAGMKGMQALETRAKQSPTTFNQDWGMYNSASPEDQQRMLEFKRGAKWLNAGDAHVNPKTNEAVKINPKVTDTPGFKSEVAKQVDTAKADVKTNTDNATGAKLATEAMGHISNIRSLAGNMTDKQLGPFAFQMPNLSQESQLMEMQINNLLGTVRDKLPGILSDSDIQLLLSMLPSMKMDKEPLMKSLDLFEKEMQTKIDRAKAPGYNQQSGGEFSGFKVLR